jgi:membrane protease YdiL (CAAX protease family)
MTDKEKLEKVKKILLIILIFFSYFIFTYNLCIALAGSLFIIIFSYLYWPKTWKNYLGININIITFLIFIALLAIVTLSTYFIIKSISISNNIPFLSKFNFDFDFLQTIGQTLNEELIFGGLILLSLKRKLKNRHTLFISILIAIVFSLFHLLFFGLNRLVSNRGILSVLTLFNLFLFRLITNLLIFYLDHIFYAWAIHLGWNIIFFQTTSLAKFNELTLFNTFIGTTQVLYFLIFLLLLSSIIILLIKKKKQQYTT